MSLASDIYPDFFKLCPEWTNLFFEEEMEKTILTISGELNKEKKYEPERENIFRCFYMTPFNNIKIVLIGQDPYHNGSATGLCFDVKHGNIINPSLQNIYKELESEGFFPTKDGNLEHWATQGILMINSALTVAHGKPESHLELWSTFFEKIVTILTDKKDFLIWVILGKKAAEYKKWITHPNHVIVETTHPSPLSAMKSSSTQQAFMGSSLFKKINQLLLEKQIDPISW